jgi:hypothetical protein
MDTDTDVSEGYATYVFRVEVFNESRDRKLSRPEDRALNNHRRNNLKIFIQIYSEVG